jgi:hypothetical protein
MNRFMPAIHPGFQTGVCQLGKMRIRSKRPMPGACFEHEAQIGAISRPKVAISRSILY